MGVDFGFGGIDAILNFGREVFFGKRFRKVDELDGPEILMWLFECDIDNFNFGLSGEWVG